MEGRDVLLYIPTGRPSTNLQWDERIVHHRGWLTKILVISWNIGCSGPHGSEKLLLASVELEEAGAQSEGKV